MSRGWAGGAAVLAAVLAALPLAGAPPVDPAEAPLESASAGRVVRVRTGTPGAVETVDLPVELYVARVLAGEGEPKAAEAAQQALAIAIRTFAVVNAGRHRLDGFDLCDTTHCQVLRPSTPAARAAALATAGQLLTYAGRPAEVFYSASCGGRSEDASQVWRGATALPYLRSAGDDAHDGEGPWVLEIPLARVERALRRAGFDGRALRDVRVEARSASQRVTRLQLPGLRPDAITGEDFRAAIGRRELRSTQFTVERDGRTLRFTGYGYGHGVGLCVVGAGRRAARGETARQILEQYYPGLRLERIAAPAAAAETMLAPVPAPAPVVRVPGSADDLARRVAGELQVALGLASAPAMRVVLHESLDEFRRATGRPWWVSAAVEGSSIALAPLAVLVQRDGLEGAVRRGVAEVLVQEALADRPAWVRVGAARYFAHPAGAARASAGRRARTPCPSDAELTLAVSASALREAEGRAEACFAAALAKAGDWRAVR